MNARNAGAEVRSGWGLNRRSGEQFTEVGTGAGSLDAVGRRSGPPVLEGNGPSVYGNRRTLLLKGALRDPNVHVPKGSLPTTSRHQNIKYDLTEPVSIEVRNTRITFSGKDPYVNEQKVGSGLDAIVHEDGLVPIHRLRCNPGLA